ncbi:YigZ family protein [Schaalia suimastitidis]|uniref:YigZ family protein n=1 Tax=Schaalia suimastitidis TaxID=121163 RepID=UPI00042710F7|nr:YigZ family protein [Schaalia suimastitidis]
MHNAAILVPQAASVTVHEMEVKRSRFISYIARTDTPQDARAFIDSIRQQHPQARHVCSAYLIAEEGHSPHQHSSDDGEPAGTAGTPILEVLRASDMWNVTAVVVRYFGGVLLGTGGLIRAYSGAVAQCLHTVPRSLRTQVEVYDVHLDPMEAGRIEAEVRHLGARVLDVAWGDDVRLRLGIDNTLHKALVSLLARLSQGRAIVRRAGSTCVEVDASDDSF